MTINPQMNFFEVTLENVKEKIKEFYDKEKHHYVTINAIDNGGNVTLDWIFSDYEEKNVLYVFRINEVSYDELIPSITDIIPSSWLAEWELADLFDLNVENAPKGLFLKHNPEIHAPLRKDS
ncbi:quinone oxidoreductase [Caminibacter mediatlanticus TB-2]|uniref:Quinone oxidoreductase n=1 Tax=Caminibacter mediatlanticus TB-2 TaxID=391592 RepID=A0AAI9AIE1_9BACT|nr:NADH-quinone oxidoreductase subunit C [Caminibacter mediatlanticus]EDM24039.1 hypothetical protein CMTB2_07286 [Caminibacter mediatlanticus TB-2]QCT94400.1 quinone oxidoreductase [Caminibacter mediatlanticus TB-2]